MYEAAMESRLIFLDRRKDKLVLIGSEMMGQEHINLLVNTNVAVIFSTKC
jgi:hypothetical protein